MGGQPVASLQIPEILNPEKKEESEQILLPENQLEVSKLIGYISHRIKILLILGSSPSHNTYLLWKLR